MTFPGPQRGLKHEACKDSFSLLHGRLNVHARDSGQGASMPCSPTPAAKKGRLVRRKEEMSMPLFTTELQPLRCLLLSDRPQTVTRLTALGGKASQTPNLKRNQKQRQNQARPCLLASDLKPFILHTESSTQGPRHVCPPAPTSRKD